MPMLALTKRAVCYSLERMPKTFSQALAVARTAAVQGILLSGHSMHTHAHLLLLAGLTALPVATTFAADEPQATLKAVTVTATRREESLQKVPVAVSVLDGEQLERDNRNGVASIAQQVPSLNFRTGASNKDTSLFVRGVGTISTSPGVEPTVATVIDGVVYARPGQATRKRTCSCPTASSKASAHAATPKTSTATTARCAARCTRPPI